MEMYSTKETSNWGGVYTVGEEVRGVFFSTGGGGGGVVVGYPGFETIGDGSYPRRLQ